MVHYIAYISLKAGWRFLLWFCSFILIFFSFWFTLLARLTFSAEGRGEKKNLPITKATVKFFDSIQPVWLGVLNREHQLEKTLASELAQKRETICCSIVYLPNFWSGISTIFLTDCCSLSFYSGRRDYEGCNSLQPYRLQTFFFDWRIHIHINTHALCTQLCRCVLSLGHRGHHCSTFHHVPAANNRLLFQQSGRMASRGSPL